MPHPPLTDLPDSASAGRIHRSDRHATFFLEAGPETGPVLVFVHGWPEISTAWRHQIGHFSALGYRVIAPDLRGCGASAPYRTHHAYAQHEIVRDMIELLDGLGIDRAVWIGHDWGSAVVWNIASHHPERCAGAASLCVPYRTLELGLDALADLLDRSLYPETEFPFGQFEYFAHYAEDFAGTTATFEADPSATFCAILRRGDPATAAASPYITAYVRKHGGWFGAAGRAPDVPADPAILSADDLAAYVAAYSQTGFFGVNSLYMNDGDNLAYARRSLAGGTLDMPVLFLSGRHDRVNDNADGRMTGPMRTHCRNLTCVDIDSGHWMQHEAPRAVNTTLETWLGGVVNRR